MAFKMAPKSPTLMATGKFSSVAKQKAAGDKLTKNKLPKKGEGFGVLKPKEKSTAGNFEPAGKQKDFIPWNLRQDAGLGGVGSQSGVKGAMGSKLRKAEYDAKGWAYDETISKASTKKRAKVKKVETGKMAGADVTSKPVGGKLAATKPVGGKPKKSKVNRADGIQVKEVPKVVGEELGKATKYVGKHLGKAAKWLSGKSKEAGNTTIVKPKNKKKQVVAKSIKERLGKKTDFSSPSKKKSQPKSMAKQTAKQKKNLPKQIVNAIAAKNGKK
tara:strand:+ start:1936 stop:2751 length:816 start_codon:yes stop_codon:yes gene_type:complete